MAPSRLSGTAAALARVELFGQLTPAELKGLSARVRRRQYPKGAVIFLRGDQGTALYVIEAGRAPGVAALRAPRLRRSGRPGRSSRPAAVTRPAPGAAARTGSRGGP